MISTARFSPENLIKIASLQKAILLLILLNILLFIPFMTMPNLKPILGLPIFIVAICQVVFIFRLARVLYGTGLAILFAVLAFIPLISLICLLIINQKATNVLAEHDVKVGFLGASSRKIQLMKELPDDEIST